MSSVDDITPVVERKLSSMGLELYEIKYHRAGRHSILKIVIDKPGGVTIDDCELASRELSVMLDVEEFSKAPYSLEVSSPGIDRPLRYERDFQRARGHDVTIELDEPIENRKRISGTVQECGNGTIVLTRDGDTVEVPLGIVKVGKVEIRFR